MQDFLQKVGTQVKEFFKSLSGPRKAALVFTGFFVVLSFTALFFWAGETAYEVLGTNFTTEDSTNVMRFLREKKIPFKVENDGKTIKVPPEAIYDLRLELATVGLPQASVVGYEVFDKQSFGTTSFVQKLNKKRALEGELMRTINNLKGVKRSRVHLALPDKAAFEEDQKRATASVVLDLDPGTSISEKQITGISRLISSAIEGMEIGDVNIVDSNGKMLSKNSTDPLAQHTASMLDIQQKKEAEYEKRVQEILGKVVGEGKVVAKVSLDLDFTQQSETQTQFDSEGSAVKSEQKESHVMDGSRPLPMGAPGAASNTPGPGQATPEVRSNTQKVFETKNYAVPERVTRSTKPVGSVKKMSVAVLLDGVYIKDPNAKAGEEAPMVYQKWSDEKLNEFRAIAASAVGVDLKRGDTLEVKNIEFRKEDIENADAQIAAFERRKMLMHMIQYAVLGLAIALFFVFVVRPFVKWLTDNTVDNMESFLPKTIEELERMQVNDSGLGTLEDAIPVIVDKVDPEKVEGEMIKEKVVTLVEGNPHKAAMILHEWVHAPANKVSGDAIAGAPAAGAKGAAAGA